MDLASLNCRPVEGQPAMEGAAIEAHLKQLSGWRRVDGAIEKRFELGDFDRTMVFVNAVAEIARAEDHHPTLVVNYANCTVRYSTHSVAGLSINAFICAAKVDALGE